MSDTSTRLPPELVAEAMSVMGQAFTQIRSATHRRYALGEKLTDERCAAVGTLSDALHNMPGWIHADSTGGWVADRTTIRHELDVAIAAISLLRGRAASADG